MSSALLNEEAAFTEATFQTEDVTLSQVHVIFTDYVDYAGGTQRIAFTGKGSAKTNPEDEFDQYLGHRLALARALQDAAAEILSDYFGKARGKRKV